MSTEQIAEIALDIADEAQTSVLRGQCRTRLIDKHEWWDTRPNPRFHPSNVRRAVNYLELRGLLIRDPIAPFWVRVQNVTALGDKARSELTF